MFRFLESENDTVGGNGGSTILRLHSCRKREKATSLAKGAARAPESFCLVSFRRSPFSQKRTRGSESDNVVPTTSQGHKHVPVPEGSRSGPTEGTLTSPTRQRPAGVRPVPVPLSGAIPPPSPAINCRSISAPLTGSSQSRTPRLVTRHSSDRPGGRRQAEANRNAVRRQSPWPLWRRWRCA
jgi:hypothetical protein